MVGATSYGCEARLSSCSGCLSAGINADGAARQETWTLALVLFLVALALLAISNNHLL
jgi:hypothetical protein